MVDWFTLDVNTNHEWDDIHITHLSWNLNEFCSADRHGLAMDHLFSWHWKNITNLRIYNSSMRTSVSEKQILAQLNRCIRLQTLELCDIPMTTIDIDHVFIFDRLYQLKELIIDGCVINSLAHVSRILRNSAHFERLTIRNMPFSFDPALFLESLGENTSLRYLEISNVISLNQSQIFGAVTLHEHSPIEEIVLDSIPINARRLLDRFNEPRRRKRELYQQRICALLMCWRQQLLPFGLLPLEIIYMIIGHLKNDIQPECILRCINRKR